MKKSFLLFSLFFLCFLSHSNASFLDVPQRHENYDAITFIQEEGIVKGYDDKTYRPNNEINRVDFTKIVIESKYSEEEIENCIEENISTTHVYFPDISKKDWFAKYVCVAKKNGIINGYPDGTFQPSQNINFMEASKIITKTLLDFSPSTEDSEEWYVPYVSKISDIQAIPNSILLLDKKITRGEMAEIIYQVLKGVPELSSTDSFISYNKRYNALERRFLNTRFSMDSENTFYAGHLLKNVDRDSFTVLNDFFAKDKNHVFYREQTTTSDADTKTFSLIEKEGNPSFSKESSYAKDINNIYYAAHVVKNADKETFIVLENSLAKDKNGIYSGSHFIPLNTESLEFLDGGYIKEKDSIYHYIDDDFFKTDIDVDTFEHIFDRYAKDKDYIYYEGEPVTITNISYRDDEFIDIPDIDTFEIVLNSEGNSSSYFMDENLVYYRSFNKFKLRKLWMDRNSFELLDGYGYARDKNSTFRYGQVISIDPNTFQYLGMEYTRDKDYIYRNDEKGELYDAETFTIIDDEYSFDKNAYYRHGTYMSEKELEAFYKRYPEYESIEKLGVLDTSDWNRFDNGYVSFLYPMDPPKDVTEDYPGFNQVITTPFTVYMYGKTRKYEEMGTLVDSFYDVRVNVSGGRLYFDDANGNQWWIKFSDYSDIKQRNLIDIAHTMRLGNSACESSRGLCSMGSFFSE